MPVLPLVDLFILLGTGSFAFGVLLMNICVPLIDMKTQPRVFGHRSGNGGGIR